MSKKIFILHGWAYETSKWNDFVSLLEADDYQVKLLKIPGLTSEQEIDRAWNLDDYATWLKKQIGKSKTNIIAHSNGARIVARFNKLYPGQVNHLVLIGAAGIPDRRLLPSVKRSVFKQLSKIFSPLKTIPLFRSLLYKLLGEQDYKQASGFTAETMKNLIAEDLTEDFKQITAKTLIVWGSADSQTPLFMGEKIHQLISPSRLEIIPSARHAPFATHPDKVFKLVKEHFQ